MRLGARDYRAGRQHKLAQRQEVTTNKRVGLPRAPPTIAPNQDASRPPRYIGAILLVISFCKGLSDPLSISQIGLQVHAGANRDGVYLAMQRKAKFQSRCGLQRGAPHIIGERESGAWLRHLSTSCNYGEDISRRPQSSESCNP